MKQRKRMGLPTARMVASRRTHVGKLSIARAAVATAAGASLTDAPIKNAVRATPDGPFEDNAITNAVTALADASFADDAMTGAVAAAPDGPFTDNTITKLMARLDDAPRGETASQQRRPLPSAPAKFQPKVLRTRANRA